MIVLCIINVVKRNKNLNTKQNYWVVEMRLHLLAICFFRTSALFIKDHPVFCDWMTKWDLLRKWTTLWHKRTTNCWSLLMSGVKSVSRHKEASAGGGSFAPQGGLITQQNLSISVSRTTFLAISTNFSTGWFYQDHRWSLINKSVVFIKWICGPT